MDESEARSAYQRQYREANKEKLAAYQRQYREANKEKQRSCAHLGNTFCSYCGKRIK